MTGSLASAWGKRAAAVVAGGSVLVNGLSLYYEASGQAEEGPTLLFLHESGGSSQTWRNQIGSLSRRARCLALDLPGHGGSEGTGCSSVSEYRQAVQGFLDALAIRWPVVLVGVCLGAAIATDLALHAPERVSGLVLCGVAPNGRATPEIRSATQVGQAPPIFVERLFGPYRPEQVLREHLRRWQQTSPVARWAALTAVAAYDMKSALAKVTFPTLLVTGAEDTVASPMDLAQLVWGLGHVHTAPVARAGCLCMVEQPDEFDRHLERYLERVRTQAEVGIPHSRPGGYRRHARPAR